MGIDALMVTSEQLTADHRDATAVQNPWTTPPPAAARAAREALRAQVAKLERELSGVVAGGFPHISSVASSSGALCGPHLLTLAELECLRDRLALRVREAQVQDLRRDELERSSRDLLERMKADPGHYKFVRLRVVDLGERGCGVWEVRPRLGLIGMLAGWWQLKLSSGCPLPGGPRVRAAPLPSPPEQRGLPLAAPDGEHRRECAALALGHRPDGLGLRHRHQRKEFASAALAPAALARQ